MPPSFALDDFLKLKGEQLQDLTSPRQFTEFKKFQFFAKCDNKKKGLLKLHNKSFSNNCYETISKVSRT